MNDRVWYIYCNNQTYGPFTQQEVLNMLQENRVRYTDYAFKEGFKDWILIGNLSDFDRRVLNPGGTQPVVSAPVQSVPATTVSDVAARSTEEKEKEQLWYIHDGKSQLGPFPASYIKDGLESKTIFWTFYVWREGMPNWVQIKEIHDFDRRRVPRGEVQVANFEITKNVNDLQKQSNQEVPVQQVQPQQQVQYVQQQGSQSSSYIHSNIDEARDKFPIKAIIFLVVFTGVLLGGVYSYPMIQDYITQYKVNKLFLKGEDFIQHEQYEEGFDIIFELLDKYPQTKAAQKSMNLLRAKEPLVKSSLADESRRIKKLMEDFVANYNVMPANARDINYTFPFLLDYFGKIYFKKDKSGKVSILARGYKIPVEGYIFIVAGDGKETENEIDKPQDFLVLSQDYFELQKKGMKTQVTPVNPPKVEEKKPEPVKVEQKKTEKPQKAIRKPPKKEVKKEPEVQEEETEEQQPQEDQVNEQQENTSTDNADQEKPETQQEVPAPAVLPQAPRTDENQDSINKILEDR